jgi:hypothetical protein
MEQTTGYYNSFVVKIWRDKGAMRGHIQHVSSQEHIYFLNLDDMANFIRSHLGPPRESVIEHRATVLVDDFGVLNQDERIFPD